MRGVLVLAAVHLEARGLARELTRAGGAGIPRRQPRFPFPVYEPATPRARVRVAPVGLRAQLLPERWATLVADLDVPLVISAGTCGALSPVLEVGDLLLPESVLGPGGERLNVTPGAHAQAVRLAPDASTGLLLTSSEVVATPEAKALCWHRTGAVAVDMESAMILAWASRQGCPSLVVRAVADTARQPLSSELVGLVTHEGKLRALRALAVALTRPATIPHALTLRRGSARALRSVARLIAALIG